VHIPAGFEPKSGSVRPKQPITSPAAIGGSQRHHCSSFETRPRGPAYRVIGRCEPHLPEV
jgi:hypothetical protein